MAWTVPTVPFSAFSMEDMVEMGMSWTRGTARRELFCEKAGERTCGETGERKSLEQL